MGYIVSSQRILKSKMLEGEMRKFFSLVKLILVVFLFTASINWADAALTLSPLFSNNAVLQRNKPCPVWGTAGANKTVTVTFNGQTKTTTSDASGNWMVVLAPMAAKTTGGTLTATETGANTVTITNVVVGDVWICSGQSNMAFNLGSCDRSSDISSANFPGIRQFAVPLANLGEPTKNLTGSWTVCSPSTASGFTAVGFYFARKIYQDQNASIPIGLILSSVGGTCIDPWLAPEGCTDVPVLQPLYSQSIMPWGPFSLFNGMIYPLAPFACKGAIWYQGENRETTNQSVDSYYLKEKALQQGWRRVFGLDDFAFYIVLLANWGTPNTSTTPDMPGATWADTRIQQVNVLGLGHAGVASAIDIGDAVDIHPKDKLDVGERLALWALKNDYGRTTIVPSGPTLRDVTVSGSSIVCSFDYVGAGLMVGSKTPYLPTQEVVGGTLSNFVIAGATGSWYAANAEINVDNTVTVSSPSVPSPRKVAYACWQNPAGCNLYNRDGLPANPFYVDDVNAKYVITASAGSGGSISPTGATTYLKRKTALYTITPDPGYYIQDVLVDGVSVGAVNSYTFDPIYSNHTIAATFSATAPVFSVTASPSAGGTVIPAGVTNVVQGGSLTYSITPNAGCKVASVIVDGKPVGVRTGFTFADVRSNHNISAKFACTIVASASYGGTISPSGSITVIYGTDQTFNITPLSGYSISDVKVDGVSVGAVSTYTFSNVTADHTISVSFSGGIGGTGSVPQQSNIIFSVLASTLPSSGNTGNWATYIPSGQSLTAIGNPSVDVINGRKWERNVYADGDGYRFGGSYSSSIACNGASIVAAVRPVRSADSGGWRSVVDVFYDRLVLGVQNDTGLVNVRRNGSLDIAPSNTAIPDGQMTILSLVVQPNGTYKVWANGSLIMDNKTTSDMTALVPGVTGGAGGFGTYINVGRNNPDGWTTFNGNIGDVFLYKTALTDAERGELEQFIASKLTDYTITASAGTGGKITPSGSVTVMFGANQSFAILPDDGYVIEDVIVDGVSIGVVTNYTFINVSAPHTITAKFKLRTYTITASAGVGGFIEPSGNVIVNYGANQRFVISPDEGYVVDDVDVDGVSQGAISEYTFYNVTSDHIISAVFASAAKPYGMNNRTVLNDPLVLGRLVRVWGKVKDISSSGAVTFRISDGYNADVVVTADNVVLPEGFGIGKMVIVTGILDADRKVIARKVVVM